MQFSTSTFHGTHPNAHFEEIWTSNTQFITEFCCCQATSHYLSQCWPLSVWPHGVTRPQCNNIANIMAADGLVTPWARALAAMDGICLVTLLCPEYFDFSSREIDKMVILFITFSAAGINSLRPSDPIDLGQHCIRYLLIITKVQWHLSEGNFMRDIVQPSKAKNSLKITKLAKNFIQISQGPMS